MADYHAVLMRTLQGLGETTPQLRAKLYERARATIGQQLESANPPMSADAVATQKAHLEAAIASIESEYQTAATASEPEVAPVNPAVQPASSPPQAAQPADIGRTTQIPRNLPSAASARVEAPVIGETPYSPPVQAAPPLDQFDDEQVQIPVAEDEIYEPQQNLPLQAKSSRLSTVIMIVVGLMIVGGGAAALWASRDFLSQTIAGLTGGDDPKMADVKSMADDGTPKTSSPVKSDEGLSASTTVEPAAVEKFDQRLNSQGQEVEASPLPENTDTLPAGLEPSPVTTTRIVVPEVKSAEEEQPQVSQANPVQENPTGNVASSNATALIAQKGFLYEEGSTAGQNTVDVGTVVWSVVQEAPGEGQPLEPTIRAKVEIANRGLVLLVTIKRNTDQALPASHLIELVFSVPDDFAGGSIDKVQRFVFKESEEARGEALVGVPATIADGIFLIALNNLPQAVERNTQLMKGREWIDIPLGYKTGRRALITLEKGIPGERVFNEVFAAWEKAG